MPRGFCRPFDERLAQERGALETPVDPGGVPAPLGHGGNARILLQFIGRGVAVALFAEGDEETRGKDRTGAWKAIKQGEVGMVLGTLCNSVVEGLDGLQGHAELRDESLDEEGMGADDTLIGGQRRGALDGLDALRDDVSVAHVMRTEKVLQGGTARKLGSLEGRPLGEKIAEDGGVFVLKPLQHLRKVGFQGTGEPICDAHFVAHETAAMFDELCEGTHRGTLGLEWLELIAVFEEEFELEFGISGVVLGVTGCEGFTYLARVSGLTGKSTRQSYLRSAFTMGPLLSSRQIAINRPLNRWRKVFTHSSIVSGVCARTRNSRVAESAACRQISCLVSAQSRPTNAANGSVGRGVMGHLLMCILKCEEGTCKLTFCEGIIGSRWRGRP
jgi:hypothetical protein